jgi:pimeloyl-ACP methyl ester carboxylesterase
VVDEPGLPAPGVTVDLGDGRVLAADDVGDPDGVPLLHLHGSPDSRFARHPDDGIAAGLGVRLVAVDRPGYGGSDPLPTPDVVAWAGDVRRLLDALGIDRCRVAAWSAGAPWAFGLAATIADRIDRVTTFGCLAPTEAFDDPDVVEASGVRAGVVEELAAGLSVTELGEQFSDLLVPRPPVDLALARDAVVEHYSPKARAEVESVPGLVDQLARSLAAAAEGHGAGVAADVAVQFGAGAGVPLGSVACPVVLVHGTFDPIAGPAVGRWLAARLPDATVEVWDHGHQGLLVDWPRWLRLATF